MHQCVKYLYKTASFLNSRVFLLVRFIVSCFIGKCRVFLVKNFRKKNVLRLIIYKILISYVRNNDETTVTVNGQEVFQADAVNVLSVIEIVYNFHKELIARSNYNKHISSYLDTNLWRRTVQWYDSKDTVYTFSTACKQIASTVRQPSFISMIALASILSRSYYSNGFHWYRWHRFHRRCFDAEFTGAKFNPRNSLAAALAVTTFPPMYRISWKYWCCWRSIDTWKRSVLGNLAPSTIVRKQCVKPRNCVQLHHCLFALGNAISIVNRDSARLGYIHIGRSLFQPCNDNIVFQQYGPATIRIFAATWGRSFEMTWKQL